MTRIALLLVAAAGVLAGTSLAATESAATLAAPQAVDSGSRAMAGTAAVDDQPPEDPLAAVTDLLRAAFVLNPETAWTIMTASERMALQTAFGTVAATRSVELAWFMRAATVHVGLGESASMTGLYNPLVDAWLLMVWARVGGEPRVVQAAFVPADRLASGTGFAAREGDLGAALSSAHSERLAQFEKLTATAPPGAILGALAPSRIADRRAVMDGIANWLGTLTGWRDRPGQPAAWRALRSEMVKARKRGKELADLPEPVRATLTPVGVVAHGSGEAVLMISPLFPALVAMSESGTGPLVLTLLAERQR